MELQLRAVLQQSAKQMGIEIDESALNRFDRFTEELLSWNKVMNLTAITDPAEIVMKHYVDSLSVLKYLPAGCGDEGSLIDVGCGAGFPSIPLKIARPQMQVNYLDALQKRLNFITAAMGALGLEGWQCLHSRAEDGGKNPLYREKYDIATARAVSQLRVLAEYCMPYVKVGGLFIAMKGPNAGQEIGEAQKSIQTLGGEIVSAEEFTLPGSDLQRTVIVIAKRKAAPAAYPRPQGKINKQPL